MIRYAILLLLGFIFVSDASNCSIDQIKGVSPHEIKFEMINNAIKLTCVSNETTVMGFKLGNEYYEHLTCSEDGWKGDPRWFIEKNASADIDATCVQFCVATGDGFVYEKSSGIKVYCPGTALLFHNGKLLEGLIAMCDSENRWRYPEIDYHPKTPMEFECREVAGPRCQFDVTEDKYGGGLHAEVDSNMVTRLSCFPDMTSDRTFALLSISLNHPVDEKKIFDLESLTCDEQEGWKATNYTGNKKPYKIGEATRRLKVGCMKYCESREFERTHTVERVTSSINGHVYINISCKNPNHDMYFERKKIEGTHVFCDTLAPEEHVSSEWRKENGDPIYIHHNGIKPDIICSERLSPSECSLVEDTTESNSGRYGVITEVYGESVNVRAWCTNEKTRITVNAVRYRILHCEKHSGWFGYYDDTHPLDKPEKIAEALPALVVACT